MLETDTYSIIPSSYNEDIYYRLFSCYKKVRHVALHILPSCLVVRNVKEY